MTTSTLYCPMRQILQAELRNTKGKTAEEVAELIEFNEARLLSSCRDGELLEALNTARETLNANGSLQAKAAYRKAVQAVIDSPI